MNWTALSRAWTVTAAYKAQFILLAFLAVLGGILTALVDPLALKYLIDSLERRDLTGFLVLAALVLLLATGLHLLNYKSAMIGKRLQNKLHGDITAGLCHAYFRQSYASVVKHGDNYHVSRLHEESREISKSAAILISLLTRIVQLLAGLAVAIYLSWAVTLILLLIVPVLIYLSRRYGSRIADTERQRHEAEAEFKSILGRAVGSYRTIHSAGLLSVVAGRIATALRKPLDLAFSNTQHAARYSAISGLYFSSAELAVILVAGWQVIFGNLSIGGLFGFMRAYQIVMQQVNGLAGLVPSFARLRAALDRHDEYLEKGANHIGPFSVSGNKIDESSSTKLIVAEDIALGWGHEQVIASATFSIEPRQRILITGVNGSGKSTLAMFIAGFLEPERGLWMRRPANSIASSFADGGFMPGAIRGSFASLATGAEGRERCRSVIEMLNLQALLSLESNSLSRGQYAKAQVALALCKDAELYVLDEPLANIDVESKTQVAACILRFTRGKALVLITHGDGELFGDFDAEIKVNDHVARMVNCSSEAKVVGM